jgi:DNA-binding transcriptional MerR regulator
MEYAVNRLAQISGISSRTLRYYDEIGLLKPARVSSNGYRVYGSEEVDRLQQILFYRELGVNLEKIRKLLDAPDFDRGAALQNHLLLLEQRKERIDLLIKNVSKTIGSLKGETTMSDNEKFEGFKQKMIDDNEKKYGKEVREKYGADVADASNKKIKGMSAEKYAEVEKLTAELNAAIKEAFLEGDSASEKAMRACELHKQWLQVFWPDGYYSKEAHIGLGEMYVTDERFKAHYDEIGEGCAEFLSNAIKEFCSR